MVKRLQNQDKLALEYLFDHFSAALKGIVLRIVRNEDVAEELLQDVFLKVWNKSGEYDPEKGRLFTWMLNIARNLAIDKTRSKDFRKSGKTDGLEKNVDMAFQTESVHFYPEHIGLKELVNKLPEEQRKLIDMMYFQGFSQSEISEELDMPLGTVKTRVRTAMNKLRSLF